MKHTDLITTSWEGYELVDSGENRKLERIGGILIDRPDPQALWNKEKKNEWISAQARFAWKQEGERWSFEPGTPERWSLSFSGITLGLSFGQFKHIGVFPEHKAQWEKIREVVQKNPGCRMLNLFGYTGGASLIAAKAGAKVTHVDASKQTMQTVKENIALSELPTDAVRMIVEDALKYAKRLVQREETFEIILLDPPAFGRGPKGEVWKIEEKLPELMETVAKLMSTNAKLVILNGYAAGYSARSFGQLCEEVFKGKEGMISYGDVGIQESGSGCVLPTGIYASWEK